MRSKEEIVKEYRDNYQNLNVKHDGFYTGVFYSSVLELLADIRNALQYMSGRDEDEEQFQDKHRD